MEKIILSIIIPYHDEPFDVVSPLFNSICNQKGIDFNSIEVLICRGDSNKFPPMPKSLPFPVRNIYIPSVNGSPGLNRQLGINNANGKYVAFFDADDTLNNDTALKEFFNIQNVPPYMSPDVIDFRFVSLSADLSVTVFDNKVPFQLWASIYRRNFLLEHNIGFEPTYYGEDIVFVYKVASSNPKRVYTEHILYNYIWRDNSAIATRIEKYATFLRDTTSLVNDLDTWDKKYNHTGEFQTLALPEILRIISTNLFEDCFGALDNTVQNEVLENLERLITKFSAQLWLLSNNDSTIKQHLNLIKDFIDKYI